MSKNRKMLLSILLLSLFNIIHVAYSEYRWSRYGYENSLVIKAIGFTGLSISSDCTVTRNPLLETISQCLGDMPAGYCYHLSCNIVGLPEIILPNQQSGCGG